MRPTTPSNPDLVAAVLSVSKARHELAVADAAYWAKGDEANRKRRDAAHDALETARTERARAAGRPA